MDGVSELFKSLESNNPQSAEEAKKRFHELFNSIKEPWLVNGIFDYYLGSGSLRSVDVLVGVREPHYRHLFDKLADALRTSHKLQALTLLGHVVRRHPTWLFKIINHRLITELLRLLKIEKEVLPLMSALLIVIILLPIIAGLFAPHLQELFEVFSHLASWNTNNPNKVPEGQLLHLQIGLYALFNRLYGMYPWNFLSYLRQQYSTKENLSVFSHTIKPMLDTVKMHPLLITASKDSELAAARWKKMEANDVIMECAKFSIESSADKWREDCSFRARAASLRSRPNLDLRGTIFNPPKGKVELGTKSVPVVENFSSNLPDCGDVWSPSLFAASTAPESAPTSITHTPAQNYVLTTSYSQEGNSPPEAAIEATPESTPVKDLRQMATRPSSTVARSLSSISAHSQPSSPMKKEASPFRFPSSSTPTPKDSTPLLQDSPGSAFQSSTRTKDSSNFTHQRIQRVILDRDKIGQEVSSLKPKPIAGGNFSNQPSSPLRVISTPLPNERSSVASPHYTLSERSEEDREVETTMRTDNSFSSLHLKRGDSGVHDGTNDDHQEEFEECVEAGEIGGCVEGGLHMPDSRSLKEFVSHVSRLRYHSQCQPDTFRLAQIDTSNVRRAISCPEIKKDLSFPGMLSEMGVSALEETDEENEEAACQINECKTNRRKEEEIKTNSIAIQTDEPQPFVYEHLFLSVFPPLEQIQQHSAPPDVGSPPTFQDITFSPRAALESFIGTTKKHLNDRRKGIDNNELKQQLELIMHQLQFERHSREVHAERNRRLLGKSRTNRALEEHNSALRDQVALMQKDIETLHKELERCKTESRRYNKELQTKLDYWQTQASTWQQRFKEAQDKITLLQKQLDEERKEIVYLNGECTKSRAELFEVKNTLEGATAAATAGREVKGELAMLQHQLSAAGELETRLRSTISSFTLRCHKDIEALMATETYKHSMSELQSLLKMSDMSVNAARVRVSEAQSVVERTNGLSTEQNELMKTVIADYSHKLKLSEQTCERINEICSNQEKQILDLRQQIGRLQNEKEGFEKKFTKSKSANQIENVRSESSTASISSLRTGVLAVSGLSQNNLQLLVDDEPGPSKDNVLL